jgi:hypothetical protein
MFSSEVFPIMLSDEAFPTWRSSGRRDTNLQAAHVVALARRPAA